MLSLTFLKDLLVSVHTGRCAQGSQTAAIPAGGGGNIQASLARAQGIQSWHCQIFLPICCPLSAVCAKEQAPWYPVGMLSAQPCFWKQLTYLPNCCWVGFFWHFFFSSPWLSKCTKVSLRQMANISPFLTSVKTSKSTFMTFHTEFFFYIPLKGHRILMSLAFMILICHVLLPSYNKLTKGKGEKQGI